jgi:hypothetical protein
MSEGRTHSHWLTLVVMAAACAEFIPQTASRLLFLAPATGESLRIGMLYVYAFVVILAAIALVQRNNWRTAVMFWTDRFLTVSLLSVLLSAVINTSLPRPMMLYAAICSIFVFRLLPMYKLKADVIPLVVLLIFAIIAPLVINLVFGKDFNFYISESFRGFFDSRTPYAFASGLALLLIFLSDRKLLFVLLPVVSIGLALSGSRAGVLAFTAGAVVLLHHYSRLKTIHSALMLITTVIIVWMAPSFLINASLLDGARTYRLINLFQWSQVILDINTVNVGLFAETLDRMAIYKTSLSAIFDGNLWFGRGDYYQAINVRGISVEAHNNILQSLLNFGLIVCLCWLFLVARLFRDVHPEGRALLTFLFFFGLFQPGFDAFLFVPAAMAVLVLAYR